MQHRKSVRDILSGLIFIGIAFAFGYAATGYERGTALRMGPGYFPLVLAGVLGVIGVAVVIRGLLAQEEERPLERVPIRGIILLLGAIAFFGVTVRGLGLVPALFLTATASALASRHNSLLRALLIAAALTILCTLIFIVGLGVPLASFGPWLRF